MADLRSFRKSVSVLKKQGLLGDAKKIDARSVLPSHKVKGKRLDTLIRKYDDIVSGKTTALKVEPKELAKFRKAGFETAQGRVLVPHTKSEIAKVNKGQVSIRSASGVERIQIPVEFHNLKQYLTDIRKNAKIINRMKRENEYFGIRLYGGQRAVFYANIQLLLDDLERYEDIQKYSSKVKQAEIYQNLEIIKISRKGAARLEGEIPAKRKKASKAYARAQAKKFRERMKGKGTGPIQRYRAMRAEQQRERRARMKRDKKALAAYNKAGALRKAKSRKKQAAKKRKQKRQQKARKRT